MYSISDYGSMIADSIRIDTHVQALRQVVKPNSVVLDIGSGLGIFALLACQLGARKVYAIEPSDAIQVAKEIAAANGYADRIEFIQNLSTQVTIPEPADVIVSDLRGTLPLFQQHISSIVDARKRFLATGGQLIPQKDTLWASVVEAPDLYSHYDTPWQNNPYGLSLQAAWKQAINNGRKGRVKPEQCLVKPQCWAILDYSTIENPNVHAELHWTVKRTGKAYGLILWFDTTLITGVHFSNTPGNPELIYGNLFLPWDTPVSLTPGDTISVALQADLVGANYIWLWKTLVLGEGNRDQIKANFKQSNFFATSLSLNNLKKRAESYVPTLNEAGKVDGLVLSLMGQGKILGEIARQVTDRFPDRFPNYQEALTHVGELSRRYT
jgi:protein arginine N-methyltransferase 1